MYDKQLSPHFMLSEMTRSDYARRNGIDNTAPLEVEQNLRALANTVLELVRSEVGSPIIVSSGYRCPALNAAVGGAASSQHMKGQAADFTIPGMTNLDVVREIVHASTVIPFDQMILEGWTDANPSGQWVHISYAPSGTERRQVMTADFTKPLAERYLPLFV